MAEEDAELKELVIQSLENNGVLSKVRAQLRASVFLALDEANTLQGKKPLVNAEFEKYLSTKNGRLVCSLVREFLQYFNLDSTLSVYEPESYYEQLYVNEDRQSLCNYLGLKLGDVNGPLLGELINKYPTQTNNANNDTYNGLLSEVKEHSFIENEPSLHSLTHHTNSEDDYDKDSFFDDPLPRETDNLTFKDLKISESMKFSSGIPSNALNAVIEIQEIDKQPSNNDTETVETNFNNITFTAPQLSSLLHDGPSTLEPKRKLPPLFNTEDTLSPKVDLKSNCVQDDDYEEDFQSSASTHSGMKSGTELSVEEEIEENISGTADDLSNEGISEGDNVTMDHTVSHISATGIDYLESV